MISVSTFFTDTFNTVDAVIGNFVSLAYGHFIEANAGMITLLFTVYVMFLGYRFLNHDHHFGMHQIMRHMIVMLAVYIGSGLTLDGLSKGKDIANSALKYSGVSAASQKAVSTLSNLRNAGRKQITMSRGTYREH